MRFSWSLCIVVIVFVVSLLWLGYELGTGYVDSLYYE